MTTCSSMDPYAGDGRYRWVTSIVSHRHGRAVLGPLLGIARQLPNGQARFILTINTPEDISFLSELPQAVRAHLTVIRNSRPLSFGANHNQALMGCTADYFLVLDPEMEVSDDVLKNVEGALSAVGEAIIAPLSYLPSETVPDNVRQVPTPGDLLRRHVLGRQTATIPRHLGPKETSATAWLPGAFMAMQAPVFRRLGGFDPRYRLYCEDVDFCLRAHMEGVNSYLLCSARVTHPARRETLKKPLHFLWHCRGLARLWRSRAFWATLLIRLETAL